MDLTRRVMLAADAAAAGTAALPRAFAQPASQAGTGKFYEKGPQTTDLVTRMFETNPDFVFTA